MHELSPSQHSTDDASTDQLPHADQQAHLRMLDHAQIQSVTFEFSIQVGLNASPHTLQHDQIHALSSFVDLWG